jgi:hypothetical protein
MVGAMRGTSEGFWAEQASGSQQPPPPPPNLAEVMARQTELINLLVQAQQTSNVNSSEEVVMTSILQWPAIRTFSVPNLHFLVRLKNLWTLMPGFILLNQSSPS